MKKYLIVEDEALSRCILQETFGEFAACDVAENGYKGFELFKNAFIEGKPYDLVCTDLIMPVMDGYELIRSIREYETAHPGQESARTKIFVISTSDSSVDMSYALLECDGDDYIVKPFRRDQLKCLLENNNLI